MKITGRNLLKGKSLGTFRRHQESNGDAVSTAMVDNLKEKPETQTGLLSITSSIYDPLGFVSPFVLKAKMIFQTLCCLRLVDAEGRKHCSFVSAKAKLALLKMTTIPRLELATAVVSVKLDKMIKHHMQIPFAESVFWSDSMIVLQYLSN